MMRTMSCLHALLVCSLIACGGGEVPDPLTAFLAPPPASTSPGSDGDSAGADDAEADALAAASRRDSAAHFTPVTMRIDDVPVPVKGSDNRYHVLYELELANFTSDRFTLDHLNVVDARSGAVVAALGGTEIGRRLVVRDKAAVPGALGASQVGLLHVHLVFDSHAAIPRVLEHGLSAVAGSRPISETAGRTRVARPADLVFDSPLRGSRYIAGDGCCDAIRHIRASLPLNGRLLTSQRFAIDWEQLDEQGRIYVGNPKDPASYVIYGKPAYAVADARVVAALDGLPDSPPGAAPENVPLEQADGNHVVLDLGGGRYTLYAHFKPRSVRVQKGEYVRRGQVLGLVGTSGNSSEPHLHFHVMDGPSPLAANGLPHRLRRFSSTHRGVSTAAFDQAIIDGKPIPTEPVAGQARRERVLPLDLWIVDFPE